MWHFEQCINISILFQWFSHPPTYWNKSIILDFFRLIFHVKNLLSGICYINMIFGQDSKWCNSFFHHPPLYRHIRQQTEIKLSLFLWTFFTCQKPHLVSCKDNITCHYTLPFSILLLLLSRLISPHVYLNTTLAHIFWFLPTRECDLNVLKIDGISDNIHYYRWFSQITSFNFSCTFKDVSGEAACL